LREFESVNHFKLQENLFLNLAYLLEESGEAIKFEHPQYGDPNLGFAITMFRVDHKAYDYADQCFRLLGKDPVRECGVTMSVTFDTPEETDVLRIRFKSLLEEAHSKLQGLFGSRTPQEHYFLKTNPVILGIDETPSNHFLFLRANVVDDLDRSICQDVLGDCEFDESDYLLTKIKVSCYRKKWRDQQVRYLKEIGVKGDIA